MYHQTTSHKTKQFPVRQNSKKIKNKHSTTLPTRPSSRPRRSLQTAPTISHPLSSLQSSRTILSPTIHYNNSHGNNFTNTQQKGPHQYFHTRSTSINTTNTTPIFPSKVKKSPFSSMSTPAPTTATATTTPKPKPTTTTTKPSTTPDNHSDVPRSDFNHHEDTENEPKLLTHLRLAHMRPKVITLDITGTLLTPNKSIAEIYTQSAAKVGIKISNLDTLSNAFNRAYRECNDLFPNFGHGQLPSSRQWWYQVVARTFSQAGYNLPYQQQDILFETIYSDFALSDHYHIYSDVIPFLNFIGKYNDYIKDPQRRKKLYEGQREKLQSCLIASSSENEDDECILSYAFHYQPILVGIISNGDARYQDSILPLLNISRYINFCVVSGNLGSRKPDYPIFDTARIKANQLSTYLGLGQQTIETQDCLHVGDSLNEDIIGAMNANFSAAYMLRDPRHEIVMDAYLEKKKLCQDGENNIHTKTTRYENNQNENHKDDKDDQNENHHNKNPPNTTDPDCNEINKMDNLDEIIQDYQTMQDLTHDRLKHLQANGIGIGVEKGSIITFRNFLQLRDAFFHDILDKL